MNNIINKLNELEALTLENIKNSKSQNTIRGYRADLKSFDLFCSKFNLRTLPADPKTVSLFITEISQYSKLSTIKRKLAAIKVSHNLSGEYIDLKNPIINENLNSIKKKLGTYQKSKTPILIDELKKLIFYVNKEKVVRIKLRNRALLLVGFCGAFRRSELVNIELDDLDFIKEGVKIFIKKSKTDQSGEGMVKALPFFVNSDLCPVINLKRWIEYMDKTNINNKKVFNMSDKNVALIVKKYANKSGLDSAKYSGHSLRSGFATSAAYYGAEERHIMAMTGHKSSQMVRRYIQESNLFKNNPLKKFNI